MVLYTINCIFTTGHHHDMYVCIYIYIYMYIYIYTLYVLYTSIIVTTIHLIIMVVLMIHVLPTIQGGAGFLRSVAPSEFSGSAES